MRGPNGQLHVVDTTACMGDDDKCFILKPPIFGRAKKGALTFRTHLTYLVLFTDHALLDELCQNTCVAALFASVYGMCIKGVLSRTA